MNPKDWFAKLCFGAIHQSNLVYNTCWEDPRIDRQALHLGPDDTVAMITSAGCNALDYALLGPRRILCADVNPRQNALLELKIAGIRALDFTTFFDLFGRGRHRQATEIYRDALRPQLGRRTRRYWDQHMHLFSGRGARSSFYFHGTSGLVAYGINQYIDRVARIRPQVDLLLNARNLDEQKAVYAELHDVFWKGTLRWVLESDLLLFLLGVPRPQRLQIERTYTGGVSRFIEDSIEAVFTRIPLVDNYFWRVYLTGKYTPECCPEYLKRENFERLRAGLVDRIQPFTGSVLELLERYGGQISRFVLLDHMDWLSTFGRGILQKQWQALLDRASPQARILWRSGGLTVDFIDPLQVRVKRRTQRLGDLLRYDHELARRLHSQDRVHTYGSFYVADVCTV